VIQPPEDQVLAAERDLADLFSTELIAEYLDHRRFVPRPWLTDRVEAALGHPGTRFVLVTGAPGTGKSALMAELARRSPGALRYFIRRDSANVLHGGDARTFLFSLGHQLAARRPELFELDRFKLDVELKAGTIAAGGRAVGIQADKLRASPFYQTALRVKAGADLVKGELIGISAGEITPEPRLLELSNLQHVALLDPARALADRDPAAQIVMLVDALDEIRWGLRGESVLDWLAAAPELPANLRFVLSCRPDPGLLGQFRATKAGELAEISLDPSAAADEAARDELSTHLHDDLVRYFTAEAAEPGLAAALTAHQVTPGIFVRGAADKAQGNFQFAIALIRGIDASMQPGQPAEELASLLRLEGVPDEIGALYGIFLGRITERLIGRTAPVPAAPGEEPARQDAWAGLYHPVLAVLAVAFGPLSAKQLQAYARVPPGPAGLDQALGDLSQFLDQLPDGRYRLYHASFPEWLTGAASPPTRVDAADAHALLAGRLRRANPDWLISADRYALDYTAAHLAAAIRLWPDQQGRQKLTADLTSLLGDPAFLVAATPDAVLPALPVIENAHSTAARAAASVYRQALRYLTGLGPAMRASQLELHAHRLGYPDLAASLATAAPDRPWRTRWSHRHADLDYQTRGENNVLALTVGALPDGVPVVVSGGGDGKLRVWRLADGAPVGKPINGHPGGVTAVATTAMPDATPVVVSGGQDGTVRVWRLADGAPVGVVVSYDRDGTARVRPADGAPVGKPIADHGDVHVVAAGALPDGTPVIISGVNQWLLAWRLADGAPVWGSITQVGYIRHPEDLTGYVIGTEDLRVPVWEPSYRTEVGWGAVEAIAVVGFPDGIHVVVSSGFRYLFMWRLTDGDPAGTPIICDSGSVIALAVAGLPDGTPVVITGDYDGNVGTRLLTDGAPLVHPLRIPGWVRCIAIQRDIVVTAADGDVAVHQLGALQKSRDLCVAQAWYELAAAGNDPAAMINLGVLLIDQDPAAAQSWFERVSGSDPEAMFNVGLRLIDRDPAAAQSWLENAAAAGNTFAMKRLKALLTNQEPAEARSWFERVSGSDPEAMFNVGVRLIDRDPAAALRWFERTASDGDSGAMVSLGMLLRDRDSAKARSWFERAAAAGNTTAMNRLALLLLIDRDIAAARPWFERNAAAGDTEAMVSLTILLLRDRDSAGARSWFERAAAAGNATAMTNLGTLVYEQDPAAAQHWWERAAEAGHTGAMTSLGKLLRERDPAAAQHWYERAAEAGDTDAMFVLGALLEERDPAAAQHWWERAAEAGHTGAMTSLGALVYERDPAPAQHWWERAAEAGDTDAMFILGRLLQQQDPATAQTWYERAAVAGHTDAMTNLGALVYERDPAAAQHWWERAAAAGQTDAMTNLGTLLREQDPAAAQTWYERAAEAGHTGAMTSLGTLLQELDPAAAQTWYERAAEAGDTGAMFVLGALLHERDPPTAQTWYERAAEAGQTGAMINLGALLQEHDPAAAQTWYERAAAGDTSAIDDLPN
jgi:TPR repeat protein